MPSQRSLQHARRSLAPTDEAPTDELLERRVESVVASVGLVRQGRIVTLKEYVGLEKGPTFAPFKAP